MKVCVNYQEEDVLREECEEARRLGYDGKVRPSLLAIIRFTYMLLPTASDPPQTSAYNSIYICSNR